MERLTVCQMSTEVCTFTCSTEVCTCSTGSVQMLNWTSAHDILKCAHAQVKCVHAQLKCAHAQLKCACAQLECMHTLLKVCACYTESLNVHNVMYAYEVSMLY